VVIGDAAGAPTTNLLLKYNLVRGGLANQTIGGGYTLTGNLIDDTGATVVPAWFVDPVTGDLHLTSLALGAIDQGVLLSLVPDDIDLQTRPINAAPDLGADESPYVVPEPAAAALICMGAAGLILRRKRP
jgi:hypothetical protein